MSVSRSTEGVNKQLLDEVEHDIMNYHNRGLCYLPKPKAEADNTGTRLLCISIAISCNLRFCDVGCPDIFSSVL